MARKTANVLNIVKAVNTVLASDKSDNFKAGVCSMVECVLFEANAYNGLARRNGLSSSVGLGRLTASNGEYRHIIVNARTEHDAMIVAAFVPGGLWEPVSARKKR